MRKVTIDPRLERLRDLRDELMLVIEADRCGAADAAEALSPSVQAYVAGGDGTADTREDRYAAIAALMGADQFDVAELERLRGLARAHQANGWPQLPDRTARDRFRRMELALGVLLAQKTGNPWLARTQRAEHARQILRFALAADHLRKEFRGPAPMAPSDAKVVCTTAAYDAYVAECRERGSRPSKEGFYRSAHAAKLDLDPRTLQRHLVRAGRTKPRQRTTTGFNGVVASRRNALHTSDPSRSERVARGNRQERRTR